MRNLVSVLLMLAFCGAPLLAQEKEADRLSKAAEVVDEVMGTPEKGIPRDLLNRAVCVGVISVYKLAVGIGGSFGRGALVCRRGGNGPWGGPSMFTLGGANIGPQLGGQRTDFVLVVMNAKGARKLLQSRSKLSADGSVAAGPVGRTAQAATDIQMSAEILTYSRAKGLFAGFSLEGAVIKQAHGANEKLYGRKVDPKDILIHGTVGVPAAAQPLVAVLNKYSPAGGKPFK